VNQVPHCTPVPKKEGAGKTSGADKINPYYLKL
jgi:hypothetical protein